MNKKYFPFALVGVVSGLLLIGYGGFLANGGLKAKSMLVLATNAIFSKDTVIKLEQPILIKAVLVDQQHGLALMMADSADLTRLQIATKKVVVISTSLSGRRQDTAYYYTGDTVRLMYCEK